MVDAQNERTNGQNRRRGRRRNRRAKPVESAETPNPVTTESVHAPSPEPMTAPASPAKTPFVRPAEIAPPTVRTEEYCVHHMASFTDCEPMEERRYMTTIRHLQVDHFGEATLYCDCLHNGPHEWPPSMQKLETAIELDQFLTDSTNAT